MGMFDGDVRDVFHTAFSGFYIDATLTRVTETVDDAGDIVEASVDEPIKCHQNPANEMSVGEYAEADIELIILQSGVSGVSTDDLVTFEGVRYAIKKTTRDPMNIYFKVWGKRVG